LFKGEEFMNRILKISMLPGTLLIIVAANTANDVWAVGSYKSNSKPYVLIEHWNGSSWSISPSPNTGQDSWLQGVVASSASNAWAVGYYLDSSGASQALIEQWNGTSWNIVANPALSGSVLYGITAFSASNIWAVGYYRSGSGITQTLVEQWDGTSWSVVPSPNPGSQQNVLNGVSASSASDIWTVGYDENNTIGPMQTLIEQWNGSSWSIVSSANEGAHSNRLLGVSSISRTGGVWAVGNYTPQNYSHLHSLTEFYC
jgi:hypothetical protein